MSNLNQGIFFIPHKTFLPLVNLMKIDFYRICWNWNWPNQKMKSYWTWNMFTRAGNVSESLYHDFLPFILIES